MEETKSTAKEQVDKALGRKEAEKDPPNIRVEFE
jgi:hypothetical protein